MYQQQAVDAYGKVDLESSVMGASQYQLMMLLLDGAISTLVKAGIYFEQGNIPARGAAISKAIGIIDSGLAASLDMKNGGELAIKLKDLYLYMTRTLLKANLERDAAAVAGVTQLLRDLAKAWRKVEQ